VEYSRKHREIVQIIPSLYKAQPFSLSIVSQEKTKTEPLLKGMVVSACIDYFKDKFILYLYFIFGKMSIFSSTKYNVHLCAFLGDGEKRWRQQKGSFPLPFLFSPSYP